MSASLEFYHDELSAILDHALTEAVDPARFGEAELASEAGFEYIAWVDASGVIIEAADTDVGVVANGRFDPKAPGTWTHLVRLPL